MLSIENSNQNRPDGQSKVSAERVEFLFRAGGTVGEGGVRSSYSSTQSVNFFIIFQNQCQDNIKENY